jgi:hypothetical protein
LSNQWAIILRKKYEERKKQSIQLSVKTMLLNKHLNSFRLKRQRREKRNNNEYINSMEEEMNILDYGVPFCEHSLCTESSIR